jgi:SHS2 domain-containing protein
VGFDISCGVRLLAVDLDRADFPVDRMMDGLDRTLPRVAGQGGVWSLAGRPELERVLFGGSRYAVEQAMACPESSSTVKTAGLPWAWSRDEHPARCPAQGHRSVPHTADLRIEAWAPTREACLAEAVTGLVASFADTAGAEPATTVTANRAAATDEDMLVGVLDEVIYLLDTQRAVPLAVDIEPGANGPHVRMHLAAVDGIEVTGAVPKAVTLHELRITRGPDGWSRIGAATVGAIRPSTNRSRRPPAASSCVARRSATTR